MKATIQQIESGIANYLDIELLSKMEKSSLEKVLVGVAISIAMRNFSKELSVYLQSPIIKTFGIADENGIDIDLLRDALKENIDDGGFKVPDLPLVGTLTFKKSDVDSLYNYITASK